MIEILIVAVLVVWSALVVFKRYFQYFTLSLPEVV